MAGSEKALRLFVGVKVSMATVEALTQVRRELQERADDSGLRVKWVAPATYHVTLKFLGWTRPETVDAIRDLLVERAGQVPSFSFTTVGLGAFPGPERARVVWAGIDGAAGRLAELARSIDEGAAGLGFDPEKRDFHAHVTLGRLKRPADVSGLIEPAADRDFGQTAVNSVVLYKSTMKSTGAEYDVLAEAALAR